MGMVTDIGKEIPLCKHRFTKLIYGELWLPDGRAVDASGDICLQCGQYIHVKQLESKKELPVELL